METTIHGTLMVGISLLLSLAGLWLVRRSVTLSFLESHHEVAGFFIGVLGVIYAVLLAFVILVVWERFEEARTVVTQEANHVGDLSRLAKGFPLPQEVRVREGLITYINTVVGDEWPAMRDGRSSPQTWEAITNLWSIYGEIEPKTARENTIYAESVAQLSSLSDSRRLRLHTSKAKVPTVMWILLWGGAITTVLFTYFFGLKSIRSQSIMTAALTMLIVFILFLVSILDRPFTGDVCVTPEIFQQEIERIQLAPAE